MGSRLLAAGAAAVLAAGPALGEAYKVNVHLEPGVGTGLSQGGFFVSGAALKVDLGLLSLGPVSPQAQIFGLGAHDPGELAQGSLFGAAIGLRWRILNDEKGYLFMPSGGKSGNLFGNLWLDAGLCLTNGGPRVGFDVAIGGELSLIDGLQVGPFAKLYFVKDAALVFGLSFSIGGPTPTAPDAVVPAVEQRIAPDAIPAPPQPKAPVTPDPEPARDAPPEPEPAPQQE